MTAAQHITAEARLRNLIVAALTRIWQTLGGYDRADVPRWLDAALPVIAASERQSIALTSAYIASRTGRQHYGLDPQHIIDGLRGGTPADEVYTRPFVTLWKGLKDGKDFEAASKEALDRATSAAETDVQLAMTHTVKAVAENDSLIVGFARVPDPGACEFCRIAAGQRYKKFDLLPLHNHCGCGVDIITAENRDRFSGNPTNDLRITQGDLTVAVRHHGELGPVLTDASQHFTPDPA